MQTKKYSLIVLNIIFLFSIYGCAYHHLHVINESGHFIDNLTVRYLKPDWEFAFGVSSPRTGKGHLFIEKSFPEKATVSWYDENERSSYSKKLVIKDNLPNLYRRNGKTVYLIITFDKNVLLAYKPDNMLIIPGETAESFKCRSENFELLNAINNNMSDEVKRIIRSGADVNRRKIGSDITPLYAALHNVSILEYLLKKGSKIGYEIVAASRDNWSDSLKLLIKYGGNVNYEIPWKYTPLVAAADKGHLEIVKILIENGADINKKIYNGLTARYVASDTEVVKYLDSKGANSRIMLKSTDEFLKFEKEYVDLLPIEIKTNY